MKLILREIMKANSKSHAKEQGVRETLDKIFKYVEYWRGILTMRDRLDKLIWEKDNELKMYRR